MANNGKKPHGQRLRRRSREPRRGEPSHTFDAVPKKILPTAEAPRK